MSSQSDYLNKLSKSESKIAYLYCPFYYCREGPFTEAALFYHLCSHYRKALAKKLTQMIAKEAKK